MMGRRALVIATSAMAFAGALHACTVLDPLDGLTGNDASIAPNDRNDADSTTSDGGDAESEPAPRCDESAHDGGAISAGFLCGVGACRKHLTGADCNFVTFTDGGRASPCAYAFPPETLGNDADDDCDGTIDEGRPSASTDAGITCYGCAFGAHVQRLANGTIETSGGAGNRAAQFNTRACINSDRCRLGTAAWMKNVSMMTCANYCKSIGGVCREACATASPACTGRGIGVNLGTFSDDYDCVVPPGHPNNPEAGAPLTGDCNATFPGVSVPSPDFNFNCCCEL